VRLRQVLLIVLDNALRFAPSGGTIRLASHVSGRQVAISVTDSGSGIPPEHLPHIFERFYQVPGQEGDMRGNGLGLSIAKGLVEAHHGKISIASQPGKGTSVQILLPAG
jgi:signal transduction histidine kinase